MHLLFCCHVTELQNLQRIPFRPIIGPFSMGAGRFLFAVRLRSHRRTDRLL